MSAKRNSFIIYKKILPWLAALALYLVFCLTGTLYANQDNYDVAIVLNGLLGNNNFCPYLHPLLCVICAGLKFLLPGADVFTLTAHILLIAALGWMIAILWDRFESGQGRVAVAAGVAYLCFGMVLWNVNYTVWAAFFSFTGCLGIYTAKDGREGRARRIAGAVFYGFGLMFRWQAAFLALPYIGLMLLSNMAEAHFKKERIKSEFLRILPWAFVFLSLTGSRLVFYSFEPWKSDLAYDSARVTLGDFPVLEWDEIKNLPEGIDRDTYYSATHWFFADTEMLKSERMQSIAEAGKSMKYPADLSGFLKCLLQMVDHAMEWEHFVPLLLLLLLCFSAGGSLKLWLSLAGSIGILFFFEFLGRAPDRVWQSVLLAALVICLTGGKTENKKTWQKYLPLCISVLLLIACFRPKVAVAGGRGNVWTAGTGADESRFQEVYEKDQIWLVGGWLKYTSDDRTVSVEYLYGWNTLKEYFTAQGKLPTERFLRHFIPSGSFWYGQEYYSSLLEELNIDNPIRSLLTEDRFRLLDVCKDSLFREHFFVYLYHRYGDMDVIREKTVEGYPLFRFERKEGGKQ